MKKRDLTFTIIGGDFKGKKLPLPSKSTTRATKAIIRGSVFDTLQFDIVGSTFAELFGGSGSMGLEALSRGASEIFFIEKEREVCRVLSQNIATLDADRCHLLCGDTFVRTAEIVNRLEVVGKRAFFYIDPPFAIREGMAEIYDQSIRLIETIPEKVVEKIIVEHMTGVDFPDRIGPYCASKSRKFGKTTLTYYDVA